MSYPEKGKTEDATCPTCGGPAAVTYWSSHPFSAGWVRRAYKARPCPNCGGVDVRPTIGAAVEDLSRELTSRKASGERYLSDRVLDVLQGLRELLDALPADEPEVEEP